MSRRGRENVFVASPQAGRWRVVVDPFETNGATQVVLTVDVADLNLGSVVSTDAVLLRGLGDRWSVQMHVVRVGGEPHERLVARLPVVATSLSTPAWNAPAAPRGGTLAYEPSWFPLTWVETPVSKPKLLPAQ